MLPFPEGFTSASPLKGGNALGRDVAALTTPQKLVGGQIDPHRGDLTRAALRPLASSKRHATK